MSAPLPRESQEAGRELDERVAIEVMGWGWMRAAQPQVLPAQRWLVPPEEYGDWGHVRPADMTEPPEHRWWLRDERNGAPGGHTLVPNYTTSIADAFLVLGKVGTWRFSQREAFYRALSRLCSVRGPFGDDTCSFQVAWPGALVVFRDDMPRLIGLAALEAAVPPTPGGRDNA